MRIAYVCADPGIPVYGTKGCSIHVQQMIRAFEDQGAQVDLYASRLDGPQAAALRRTRVIPLPASPEKGSAERETFGLKMNGILPVLLAENGPYDLVYERYSLWSCAAMEYARSKDIPGILEVNAPLIEEQSAHRTLIHRDEAERVAARAFNGARALIAVSEEVAAYLKTCRTEADGIYVIPNAINPENYPRPRIFPDAFDREPFRVGFLGTLKPWHGVDRLVEAFAQFHSRRPNSRLIIVGDGPERSNLEQLIDRLDLSGAVRLTGAVPHDRIAAKLVTWDAAVAPYPDLSNFYFSPLKIFEYMAAGLAVVASNIGQIPTLIDHGTNGLLCPPGNVDALAEALDRLSRNPGLCRSLGERARAAIMNQHTWSRVADQVCQIAELKPLEIQ